MSISRVELDGWEFEVDVADDVDYDVEWILGLKADWCGVSVA